METKGIRDEWETLDGKVSGKAVTAIVHDRSALLKGIHHPSRLRGRGKIAETVQTMEGDGIDQQKVEAGETVQIIRYTMRDPDGGDLQVVTREYTPLLFGIRVDSLPDHTPRHLVATPHHHLHADVHHPLWTVNAEYRHLEVEIKRESDKTRPLDPLPHPDGADLHLDHFHVHPYEMIACDLLNGRRPAWIDKLPVVLVIGGDDGKGISLQIDGQEIDLAVLYSHLDVALLLH